MNRGSKLHAYFDEKHKVKRVARDSKRPINIESRMFSWRCLPFRRKPGAVWATSPQNVNRIRKSIFY
jgi:hypothetical protein